MISLTPELVRNVLGCPSIAFESIECHGSPGAACPASAVDQYRPPNRVVEDLHDLEPHFAEPIAGHRQADEVHTEAASHGPPALISSPGHCKLMTVWMLPLDRVGKLVGRELTSDRGCRLNLVPVVPDQLTLSIQHDQPATIVATSGTSPEITLRINKVLHGRNRMSMAGFVLGKGVVSREDLIEGESDPSRWES